MTLESRLKDTCLSNEMRKLDTGSVKVNIFSLNQVCLLECMLFQIASPTFFSGLPNNDHPELGQSKKLSIRVV